MVDTNTLQILSGFEIFRGLTESDIEILHAKCQGVKFKESEILMKEGQVSSAIYIIINGQVDICLPEQDEKVKHKRPTKVKLATESEGDFFGEYSFVDSQPASASVVATQAGELIKITKSDLDNILENNDHIAKIVYLNILRVLVRRLRHINKEYDEIYIL